MARFSRLRSVFPNFFDFIDSRFQSIDQESIESHRLIVPLILHSFSIPSSERNLKNGGSVITPIAYNNFSLLLHGNHARSIRVCFFTDRW